MTTTEPTSTETSEPTESTNLYLDGNFAPVTTEVTHTDLEVTGTVPEELTGRYVRTGPNPMAAEDGSYHWFSGDGMVHGVDLRDGGASWYRNRWVRSPEIAAHFGEADVPRDVGGWYSGSGNTNSFHHAGRVWAVTEGSLPYEIGPELETLRTSNFGGVLPGGTNAHPKFDPETNDLHVVSYGFEAPFLRYHVIDASGQLTRTEEIEMGGPVMVHDMGFTSSRVVFFDLPVVFQLELALNGVKLPFRWDPEYRSRVGVMPRAGTAADTTWIDVEPCYVYHPLNAYDDGDKVIMDLVVHPRAFDDDRGDPSQGSPTLQRWTIDLAAETVTRDVIDDRTQEFPRADERLAGRRHRFGYSLSSSGQEGLGGLGGNARTSLLKHDVVAGTTIEHEFLGGGVGSEFVFVPRSADAAEDEGWLVGYVFDPERGASDLQILDAQDFTAPPVASVHLRARVPQGFHGNWMPDSALHG